MSWRKIITWEYTCDRCACVFKGGHRQTAPGGWYVVLLETTNPDGQNVILGDDKLGVNFNRHDLCPSCHEAHCLFLEQIVEGSKT